MDFTIRKAAERAYEGLCEIYSEGDLLHSQALPQIFAAPQEPFRNREFISGILKDENAAMVVAESSGEIIGLVHVSTRESLNLTVIVTRRYAYIGDIPVTGGRRSHGIGKALMREAEQWAFDGKSPNSS